MTAQDKQNILQGLVNKDIKYVAAFHNDGEEFHYLQYKYKTTHAVKDYSIDKLIKTAWLITIPDFIHIKNVCTDIIGNTVYVDKTLAITVDSISLDSNGGTVKSTTGRTYSIDSLYIKE